MNWAWLTDAFSLEGHYEPLTEREDAMLSRIAAFIVKRRMVTPAILMLETVKPLNYVGSQAMVFFEPLVKALFTAAEYDEVQKILERRTSLEVLITKIEQQDGKS